MQHFLKKQKLGLKRLELLTPALSEQCSNQLSYKPNKYKKKEPKSKALGLQVKFTFVFFPFSQKGGDPAAPSGTATLLRLHPPYRAYLRRRPPCG